MSNKTYQFGLLITVFGGFLSLNGSHFGDLSSLFRSFGIFILSFGMVIGVIGLLATTD